MNLKSQIHRISCFPYRHFERSREIFLALCSFLLLSQKVSHFPLSHIRHYPLKSPRLRSGWRYGNSAFQTYSLYATWNKPIPPTVISSAARNLPCTLLFLTPFAKGFPFSAVSHTTLYRCARKIPRLRSGWRYRNSAFQTYSLYATWNKPIPPYRHFERSEKSSSHSTFSCSFRKRFPLFRCLTYGAIPVCQKDPSTSLGMTLRE